VDDDLDRPRDRRARRPSAGPAGARRLLDVGQGRSTAVVALGVDAEDRQGSHDGALGDRRLGTGPVLVRGRDAVGSGQLVEGHPALLPGLGALTRRSADEPTTAASGTAGAPLGAAQHPLEGEAGTVQRALLGEVVDVGARLHAVHGRRREQVVGQQSLRPAAVALSARRRAQGDADVEALRAGRGP
jgi:hypothetical protein